VQRRFGALFLGRFLPKLGGASAPPFFCQTSRGCAQAAWTPCDCRSSFECYKTLAPATNAVYFVPRLDLIRLYLWKPLIEKIGQPESDVW
jgi:hypothetical protein